MILLTIKHCGLMVALEIIKPSISTTIQDTGRTGYLHMGISEGGAQDKNAWIRANSLIGNCNTSAAIEMAFDGMQLKCINACKIGVAGVEVKLSVNNTLATDNWVHLTKNDMVYIKVVKGMWAYLAISGGISSQKFFHSKSHHSIIDTGIQKLQKGSIIKTDYHPELHSTQTKIQKLNYLNHFITVSQGPEFAMLSENEVNSILNSKFTIASTSNRMASQFIEKISVSKIVGIVSGPVIPGTVQCTPEGKLIALQNDCQTVGGYARILIINQPSLTILSQKTAGENIQFTLG